VEANIRFSAFKEGKAQPADGPEALSLAKLCQGYKHDFAGAAGLYAQAFTAEPKLAEDLDASNRYNAGCAAALAGSAQGQDASDLDEAKKARFRAQSLDWLRADLAARKKRSVGHRPALLQELRHWQRDPDLSGVRGEALTRLPEAERKLWQQLWQDIEDLIAEIARERN
jgi:hypothetical protein